MLTTALATPLAAVLAAPCGGLADGSGTSTCTTTSVTNDVTGIPGSIVSSIAGSAWDAVCASFADAATTMLKGFAEGFAVFPSINPADAGITSVYSISLGIAALVAALLLLLQIARTVITHDGTALAQAITGLGKSVLAFLLTLSVSAAAISAANELTQFIINRTFTDTAGLQAKLTALFVLNSANGVSGTLLLILGLAGILMTLVLWFELLLANAAIAVMIGTSPIAAAGQTSALTAGWWPKLVSATVQLIILKPVIALVFAVGFGLAGNSTDLAGNLSGLLVLLLAALAWPAIARFFTFASVAIGGGSGLAALAGFAAGRMNGASSGQTPPGSGDGATGDDFASTASGRALATHAARGGTGAGAGGGSAAAGAGAGGGGAAGGAAAAGPAAPAVLAAMAAVDAVQRGVNALTGRMEQTARHAGLDGANAHPYPAGYPRHTPVPLPRPAGSRATGSSGSGEGTATGSAADLTWAQEPSPQIPAGTGPAATPAADTGSAPSGGEATDATGQTSGPDTPAPPNGPPSGSPGHTGAMDTGSRDTEAGGTAAGSPMPSTGGDDPGLAGQPRPVAVDTAPGDTPVDAPARAGQPAADERRAPAQGAAMQGQARRHTDPGTARDTDGDTGEPASGSPPGTPSPHDPSTVTGPAGPDGPGHRPGRGPRGKPPRTGTGHHGEGPAGSAGTGEGNLR